MIYSTGREANSSAYLLVIFGEVFTGSIALAHLHLSQGLFSQEAVVASAMTTHLWKSSLINI